MKKIKSIILGTATALVMFSSCSDWLDVNPRSEVKESILFSTEDGFKKALTGAYILTAKSDLYGENTSMYMPELFARHWTFPTDPTDLMNRLSNFDYTQSGAESLIGNVWLSYYKVIVQLNDILQNLDDAKVNFANNNDDLIRGEALGLRAFLHFDLLRYFGPVPSGNDLSAIAIPYVMEKTKDPSKLISIPYSEVIQKIEADLNAAEQLLEGVDPILRYSNITLNSPAYANSEGLSDSWHWFRQERFNYYACLGTKARFYQWTGNNEKAVNYAKKVIEAVNSDNTSTFTLTKETDYVYSSTVNLTMRNEQLFGIQNPDLQSTARSLFDDGTSTTLTQTVTNMNNCYENSVNASDIRYKPTNNATRYWEEKTYQNSVRVNHFRKYTGNDLIRANNIVPILRLAEMYLILIENLPLDEAATYFATYRAARGLNISTEASSMANDPARMARLEKEYRKEFFGEGQMFFFYKRLNYKAYTWPASYTLPVGAYVVPKPKAQLSFE